MTGSQEDRLLGLPQAVITAAIDWARQLFSPLSVVQESLNQKLQTTRETCLELLGVSNRAFGDDGCGSAVLLRHWVTE